MSDWGHNNTSGGIHVPSHRPLYAYQRVDAIATVPRSRQEIVNQYLTAVTNLYRGNHQPHSPNYHIKETLISLATFGCGNQVVQARPEYLQLFEKFQDVLRRVLPRNLGFQRLAIRIPEVVLVTRTGDFSLDAVSGGARIHRRYRLATVHVFAGRRGFRGDIRRNPRIICIPNSRDRSCRT